MADGGPLLLYVRIAHDACPEWPWRCIEANTRAACGGVEPLALNVDEIAVKIHHAARRLDLLHHERADGRLRHERRARLRRGRLPGRR